jgi:ribosomal protein S12 methylthiotransferase
MKTKTLFREKVNIVTLGCSKNLVDSENLLTQLQAGGIEATHEKKRSSANVVVINTCGFIDNAKQESIDTILEYVEAKKRGKIDKVYVTGCLSQRYRQELETEIPEVDAFFGTNELPALLKKFKVDYRHELLGERITTTAKHFAYLKISEGCDRPCSFCAIPLMRGGHVSRPIEELVAEAKNLAKKGVKELLLIAQDSTFYGLDLYRKRNLALLLDHLADVEGIEWIRLHYAFPAGFPMDVLDVMAKRPNICKYLDIPLQHGSTEMLKIMRRGITRPKTEELLSAIREKIPQIAIRTTLIVGHPGETPEQFEQLVDFVEKMRFERLGVFCYSHEEKTASHQLPDDVPTAVKEQRAAQIMSIQEEISTQINQTKVGKTLKVLIDKKEGGYFVGRTEHDSYEVDNEVLIDASQHYLQVGSFAQIKITQAEEFDLFGEPIL